MFVCAVKAHPADKSSADFEGGDSKIEAPYGNETAEVSLEGANEDTGNKMEGVSGTSEESNSESPDMVKVSTEEISD